MIHIDEKYYLLYPNFNTKVYYKELRKIRKKVMYDKIVKRVVWEKRELFDFGWGPVIGYARDRDLSFEEMWTLFSQSEIQENTYGAYATMNRLHPSMLLDKLIEVFESDSYKHIINRLVMVGLDRTRKGKIINEESNDIVVNNLNKRVKIGMYIDKALHEASNQSNK